MNIYFLKSRFVIHKGMTFCKNKTNYILINPFQAIDRLLCLLKTSEKHWTFYVFRE